MKPLLKRLFLLSIIPSPQYISHSPHYLSYKFLISPHIFIYLPILSIHTYQEEEEEEEYGRTQCRDILRAENGGVGGGIVGSSATSYDALAGGGGRGPLPPSNDDHERHERHPERVSRVLRASGGGDPVHGGGGAGPRQ